MSDNEDDKKAGSARSVAPSQVVVNNTNNTSSGGGGFPLAAILAGVAQATPSILTTVFGESKTDTEYVEDAQRAVRRQARRAERDEFVLNKDAERAQQRAQAEISAGRPGPQLRRALHERGRAAQRLDRAVAMTNKMNGASDGLAEKASNLRVMHAAAITTDALTEVNHNLHSASAQGADMAADLETQSALMEDQTSVVSDALGTPDDSALGAQTDRDYAAALEVMMQGNGSAVAARRTGARVSVVSKPGSGGSGGGGGGGGSASAADSAPANSTETDAELRRRFEQLRSGGHQ